MDRATVSSLVDVHGLDLRCESDLHDIIRSTRNVSCTVQAKHDIEETGTVVKAAKFSIDENLKSYVRSILKSNAIWMDAQERTTAKHISL